MKRADGDTIAVISVTVNSDGSISVDSISVPEATITGITISVPKTTIEAGETITASANVIGTLNYNKEYTWSYSDGYEDIVDIVQGNGSVKITGKKNGTVTIVAKSVGDPEIVASKTITVVVVGEDASLTNLSGAENAEFNVDGSITDFDGDGSVTAFVNETQASGDNTTTPYWLYYPVALDLDKESSMTLKVKYADLKNIYAGPGVISIHEGKPYNWAHLYNEDGGIRSKRFNEASNKGQGWDDKEQWTVLPTYYAVDGVPGQRKLSAGTVYTIVVRVTSGTGTNGWGKPFGENEPVFEWQVWNAEGTELYATKFAKVSQYFGTLTDPIYFAIGAAPNNKDAILKNTSTKNVIFSDISVIMFDGVKHVVNSVAGVKFEEKTLTIKSSDLKQNYASNGHVLSDVTLSENECVELQGPVKDETFTVKSVKPGKTTASLKNQKGTIIGYIEFTVSKDGSIEIKVTSTAAGQQPYIEEPDFAGNFSPENEASSVYEDTNFMIKFSAAPIVSSSSTWTKDGGEGPAVKIYKKDGTLVDTIYGNNEQIISQAKNEGYRTIGVMNQLITVAGNTVIVKPHKPLQNETEYYVVADAGLFTVNGVPSPEIGGATNWKFTTRTAPTITGNTITIGTDKNYSTIQAALDYLADKSGAWTIKVDPGTYRERLSYAGNVSLTLDGQAIEGERGKGTEINWANCNVWSPSTRQRTLFLWEGKDLNIRHITIKNTLNRAVVGTSNTQAETVYFDSTSYMTAFDSSFLSHQDTILVGNNGGRCWFYNCVIEGDTDFIWGYPDVALFEKCEIRCLHDEAASSAIPNCILFASRTVQTNNANKGLVLLDSDVYADDGVNVYYGRNSGSDTTAAVVFSRFHKGLAETLWQSAATKYDEDVSGVCAIGYKDYGNVDGDGKVILSENRLAGCYGLSKEVAEREYIGRNAILNRGWDASARIYRATTTQWDISGFETEFKATEDKSKKVIYIEPAYVPYLAGGDQKTLSANLYDGTKLEDVTYSVDPASLGSVVNSVFTATEGKTEKATITGMRGDYKGLAEINVIPDIIPATKAELNWVDSVAEDTIEAGDFKEISVVYTPANLTDDKTEWVSSDESVLRVKGGGAIGDATTAVVQGFSNGTATLTARNKLTKTVYAEKEITVLKVYRAKYFQKGEYTTRGTTEKREGSITCGNAEYGVAGGGATKLYTVDGVAPWDPTDDKKDEGGFRFESVDSVNCQDNNLPWAWADFKVTANAPVKFSAIDANVYSGSTSNERGMILVSTDNGKTFTLLAEVAADNKLMKFQKVAFSEKVSVAKDSSVIFRLGVAMISGKTQNKAINCRIGNVNIYYRPDGEEIPFDGADGDYDIKDYAPTDSKDHPQKSAYAFDGTSADGKVSWKDAMYHSEGYGVQFIGDGLTSGEIKIKVGGPAVISIMGSVYSRGILTVTDSESNIILDGVSMQTAKDKTAQAFLYEGEATTLTLSITGSGGTYVGTINVSELTTQKKQVTSVTVEGSNSVSTSKPITLSAIVDSLYFADPSVIWSSSDETVATVSNDGTVTGKKAGTVTITATSKFDSTKKGTKEITVTEDAPKPEIGVTYEYDFNGHGTETGSIVNNVYTSNDTFVTATARAFNHGLATTGEQTMSVMVAGPVKLTVTGCRYDDENLSFTVTNSAGDIIQASTATNTSENVHTYASGDEDGTVTYGCTYEGKSATTLTFKYSGQAYIHGLKVETAAVSGETYAYDFNKDTVETGRIEENVFTSKDGLVTGDVSTFNHGLQLTGGKKINVRVAGPVKLTFTGCRYDNEELSFTVTNATGDTVQASTATNTSAKVHSYASSSEDGTVTYECIYKGETATILTFAFSAQAYVHALMVEPYSESFVSGKYTVSTNKLKPGISSNVLITNVASADTSVVTATISSNKLEVVLESKKPGSSKISVDLSDGSSGSFTAIVDSEGVVTYDNVKYPLFKATWDFTTLTGTSVAGLTTQESTLSSDVEIPLSTGSGASFTLKSGTRWKVNSAIITSGAETTTASIRAVVHVNEPCTISLKGGPSGGYSASKIRTFYFSGQQESGYVMGSTGSSSEKETISFNATEAGDYEILCNGVRFYSLTCVGY